MRSALVIGLAALGCAFLQFEQVGAATITATTTSRADINAAVAAAQVGDTVLIPAGTVPSGTAINLTKGISIRGAGVGQTTINGAAFTINLAADNRLEISDMTLAGSGGSNTGIQCNISAVHPDQIRFHNLAISNYEFGIHVEGCHGVVHNTTFTNNDHDFRNVGYTSADLAKHSVAPPWLYDSLHQFVVEDSTFNWTGTSSIRADTEYPATFVIRYSTFNITNDDFPQPVDMHGSAGTHNNQQGVRMYNNMFNLNTDGRCADLRGGMNHLFYNNTLTGPGDCAVAFSANPGGSQVAVNNFVWNNSPANRWTVEREDGATSSAAPPSNFTELPYPHPMRQGSGGVPRSPLNLVVH